MSEERPTAREERDREGERPGGRGCWRVKKVEERMTCGVH
jgi:hypothetical protein